MSAGSEVGKFSRTKRCDEGVLLIQHQIAGHLRRKNDPALVTSKGFAFAFARRVIADWHVWAST